MIAILLSAGIGSRLAPITTTIPKCLVPIGQQPLLTYWLNLLAQTPNITKVCINLHHLAGAVSEFLDGHERQHPACPPIERWHEKTLRGTAGTLRANYKTLQGQPLLVIHADNFSIFPLEAFINHHKIRPVNCAMSMMLFKTETPSQCGIVTYDSMGAVDMMYEKHDSPPSNIANGAVYLFDPSVLEWLKDTDCTDLSTELIPNYYGRIWPWINKYYHRDIGTPQAYQQACQDFSTLEIKHSELLKPLLEAPPTVLDEINA